MTKLNELRLELKANANPTQAKNLQRFFKTGKGEYAEGDIFYGIKVPLMREIAKKYTEELTLDEAEELLHSKVHGERFCSLIILIQKYKNKKTTEEEKKQIYELYLRNTKHINNWDLVDVSAPQIIGGYLFAHPTEKRLLTTLANSKMLWEKRISILATFYFINQKEYGEALEISKILLKDEHDLIHKAVGWMLREVGKKNQKVEEEFLLSYYKTMPRTMLRYAIEKFPEKKRKMYLEGKI